MRLPRTQIVTLANQKGGCGKTTGSVSLAAAFALEGYSVALVDADPQCNATDSFGIDKDCAHRGGPIHAGRCLSHEEGSPGD